MFVQLVNVKDKSKIYSHVKNLQGQKNLKDKYFSIEDHQGCHVICNIKFEDQELTLHNVYAPNNDDPTFFIQLFKTISKHMTDNVIIGGNFNVTLDPKMDRLDSLNNNTRAALCLKSCMEELDFVDIWHIRNTDKHRYTWFRHGDNNSRIKSASRIDYFLTNVGLVSKILETNINSGCRTDHALIELTLQDDSLKKGPGIWKFNNKLLSDTKFCKNMSQVIEQIIGKLKRSGLSDVEKWITVKTESAQFVKDFTRNQSKNKNRL